MLFRSLELLHVAQGRMEACGCDLIKAKYNHIWGVMYQRLESCDEARSKLTIAKELFIASGSKLEAAQCLRGLGEIAQMEHKYEDAKVILSDAKKEFYDAESRNMLGLAQCIQCLGEIARMEGSFTEAKHQLSRACKLFIGIGSRLGAAQCLRSLGDIARMERSYEWAWEMLTDARRHFSIIGCGLEEAQCWELLGDIARHRGDNKAARYNYAQAIKIYEEKGIRSLLIRCRRDHSRLPHPT